MSSNFWSFVSEHPYITFFSLVDGVVHIVRGCPHANKNRYLISLASHI